jgi:hypothetical protein
LHGRKFLKDEIHLQFEFVTGRARSIAGSTQNDKPKRNIVCCDRVDLGADGL